MSIRKRVSTGLVTLCVVAGSLLSATGALAATAPPTVSTEAATALTPTSATLHGAVNPEGTPVTACQFEIGPFEGFYTEAVPCAEALPLAGSTSVPVSAALTGLTPGGVYYYRVSATNENGTSEATSVQSFATPPAVEGVSTAAATAVASSTAMLNGSLEPNGTDAHYHFEYGITSEYGSSTSSGDAGSQSGPTAVSTALTGLLPNQEYHFRLVAQNGFGVNRGADEVFITSAVAPVIEGSGPPVSVSRGSALLAFNTNAQNSLSTYQVEYGPDTSYGARSAPIERSTGVAEAVDLVLDDLIPGTLYHYRLLASNATGSVSGPDETFTTSAATPPLVATGGANAIGQNSATITASVNPQGLDTIYGFEVGTGAGYGLPTGLGTVSAGEEGIALALSGLQAGTTYHYRVLASNADGVVYGSDQAFTTTGVAVPLTAPVSPPLISTPNVAFPSVKAPAKAKAKSKSKPKKKSTKKPKRKAKRKPKGKVSRGRH
jgi:phosphodiesterase/alkaline phosphatase D-like protein